MKAGFLFLTVALAAAAPILAAPASFALVNATGGDIQSMDARKTGTSDWKAVPYAARTGTSGAATFDNEDCAWDLRVTLAPGGTITYPNVNPCEAQLLTLRRKDGVSWVDYD